MKRNALLGLVMLAACATPALASNVLIESWENTLDGWAVPPSYNLQPAFGPAASFSNASGVTNGTYSLAVTGNGGSGPGYGQLAAGPSSMALTTLLSTATSVSLDVYTPAGSFGGYLQFDIDINNNDTGFQSLDGYSYPSTTLGSETTITVPVSPALDAQLAASSNPTSIDIQVGGGDTTGNETMYLDNLRANVVVPEPASIGMIGVGALGLLRRRRV